MSHHAKFCKDLSNRSRDNMAIFRFFKMAAVLTSGPVRRPNMSHRANEIICNLAFTFGPIAKIPSSFRKSGSGNTRATSDF